MADWTTLPNAAVGVGGLPSGTTVTALRDNPVAIAQGATGAPRNVPRALSSAFVIGGASGSGTAANGFTDLDTNSIIRIDFSAGVSGFTLTRRIQLRASANNGSTWSGWVNLCEVARGVAGCVHLNTLNGDWRAQSLRAFNSDISGSPSENNAGNFLSGSFAESGINAFQVRMDNSGSYAFHAEYVSRGDE